MVSETDKQLIQSIARKYRASRVLLFGSSLHRGSAARDIDLAVEGLEERDFFSFYGDLLCALSRPVDVVALSGHSRFVELVRKEGVPLYHA